MRESVTQPPGTNSAEAPNETGVEHQKPGGTEAQPAALSSSSTKIIWTPRFIVIFSLTLVLGLSAESLLTQGWLNSYYPGWVIFLAYISLICVCWIAITALTRSWWTRLGTAFGCIWAIFMSINILLNLQRLDPGLPILAHLNAAACIALLGASLCFSVAYVSLGRWDTWFFGLAPIGGTCAVIGAYLLTPATTRSLSTLELSIALVALALSILTWWMRPSCWQAQPCLALLLGTSPLILLSLAVSNYTSREPDFLLSQISSFPIHSYFETNETRFFFFQITLFCLLLGAMRILQSEIRKEEV
jgi:hypothetical protein